MAASAAGAATPRPTAIIQESDVQTLRATKTLEQTRRTGCLTRCQCGKQRCKLRIDCLLVKAFMHAKNDRLPSDRGQMLGQMPSTMHPGKHTGRKVG